MKGYIIITILLSCFITDFVSADITPEYAQVIEDLSIMSAIIDKALSKAFPGEYKEKQFFLIDGIKKCQGFYLKDYGVLFIAEIGFPVSALSSDKEEKRVKSDDLWEITKRELSGLPMEIDKGQSYDQGKVDRLKDELLKVISDYSGNIRHLGPNSTITIIMIGKTGITPPANLSFLPISEAHTQPMQIERKQPPEPVNKPIIIEGVPAEAIERYRTVSLGIRQKPFQTIMIINVKKRDVIDFKDGKIKYEDFSKNAEIIQY